MTLFVGIHDLPEPGSEEDRDEPEGSERVYNTQVVISPAGDVVAYYRKVGTLPPPSYAPCPRRTG